ncbi:SLBB domain-containing protein [Capilliphycus salinus ALCB114379]|uniref:SLBB domain-containing protein n=1 Tax=Capilliphycus salinus TaxID=2768948 RepID=UPI0039A60F81
MVNSIHRLISVLVAGLYSGSWTLGLTVLIGGVDSFVLVRKIKAQEIPDQCVLPQEFVDRKIELLEQVEPQYTPEILRLFQRPGSPPRQVEQPLEPNLIPVDISYFERANENQIERYRLGPGDQIFIDIFVNGLRSAELSIPNAVVGPEGTTIIPLIGTVRLEGLFLQDIEREIQTRLNQFVKNPQVNVSLLAQRPVQVTVTGQVARPGFYPLGSPQLAIALSTAGGTRSNADLRSVQLRRNLPDGRTLAAEIDLLTPLLAGLAPPDIRLEDRDIIYVPTQETLPTQGPEREIIESYSLAAAPTPVEVTIVGQVVKPGFYTLPAGLGRVSAAILAAGGATLTADLRSVIVCRVTIDGRVIQDVVDLYSPLEEATALPNVALSNGDSVIVPQLSAEDEGDYNRKLVANSTLVNQQITVRILSNAGGAVGSVNLPNGSTFVDILNNVPLATAKLDEITLIRFDPQQGRAITRTLNGREVLQGDPSDNILLQDEDVIVIDRNFAADVSYFLNTFTQPFRDILGFLLFFREISNAAEDLFGPNSEGNRNR